MVTYARWLKRHGYELRSRHPEFICTRAAYDAEFGKMNALLNELERDGLCRVLHPAEECLFRSDGEDGEACCRALDDGSIAFKDKTHISVSTSLRIIHMMRGQLQELLRPSTAPANP